MFTPNNIMNAINKFIDRFDSVGIAAIGGAVGMLGVCTILGFFIYYQLTEVNKSVPMIGYTFKMYPLLLIGIACIIISHKILTIAVELNKIQVIKLY